MKALCLLLTPLALCAQVLDTVIGFPGWTTELLYVPAGNKLYVKLDSPELHVIDCSTYSTLAVYHLGSRPPSRPKYRGCWNWQRDKVYWCVGWDTAEIAVIDNSTDSLLRRIQLPARWGPIYYPSGDRGDRLYVAGDGVVSVIDCETDSLVKRISAPDGFRMGGFVALDSVGNKLYTGRTGWTAPGAVYPIDCATDSALPAIYTGIPFPDYVALSATQRKLYVGYVNMARFGAVVDCAADTFIKHLPIDPGDAPVVWNSIEDKVYWPTEYWGGDTVFAIDCRTDSIVGRIPMPDSWALGIFSQCVVPWSNRLYVISQGWDSLYEPATWLTVVDCRTDSILSRVLFGKTSSADITCNPAQKRIYVSSDSAVYVFRDEILGVAEPERPARSRTRLFVWPNPARGWLYVAGASVPPGETQVQPIALYAISGRKVMELTAGENDIRHLAPGVYFVRQAQAQAQAQAQTVRKIVVQR